MVDFDFLVRRFHMMEGDYVSQRNEKKVLTKIVKLWVFLTFKASVLLMYFDMI